MHISRVGLIVIVVLVLLCTGAAWGTWEYGRGQQWWGETDRLKALKATALADETLVGYPVLQREQTATEFLRKHTSDHYSVWYDPEDTDSNLVRDRIVELAQQNGFAMKQSAPGSDRVLLDATDAAHQGMHAWVAVVSAEDSDGNEDLVGSVQVYLYFS